MIPVNEPLLIGNELQYLQRCLETGWISSEGPFVKEFEAKFAERVGRSYAAAVCNGTAALELAVSALGLGAGDEVIMPAFTIISCALAVVRAGAVPVLVDCDSLTWNMDVSQVEEKITPRTRAIMPAHIYGLPVDMTALMPLAKKYNLQIIEDAAEAHGQTCDGRPCGSFGNVSTFSFYANKLVTTGEGGMLVTDDTELYEKIVSKRNLCFQAGNRFVHEELGYNFRMTNLQAALGVAQLEQLDEFVTRKRCMGRLYHKLLEDVDGLQLPAVSANCAENVYWVFGVVLESHIKDTAHGIMKALGDAGVGTRPFFCPMHQQPALGKLGLFAGESYPVSERLSRRGFYLPSGLALTEDQVCQSAAALRRLML